MSESSDTLSKLSSVPNNGMAGFSSGSIAENSNDVGGRMAGSKRLAHMHKLERKHSSGDLHSRLKTRKLLGVGETDDGDVHRSKLSQILGHSDQLYIKLPPGLRLWQFAMAAMFSFLALWALLFPKNLFETVYLTSDGHDSTLSIRLYGSTLLSLALVFWSTLQCVDRDVIRLSLIASVVYFGLQAIVTGSDTFFTSSSPITQKSLLLLLFRIVLMVISSGYSWVLSVRFVSLRRSTSNKDLSPSAVTQRERSESLEKDKSL